MSALTLSHENGNNYVMGLLVDMNDPGLMVFPTHRLVRQIPHKDNAEILRVLRTHFQVEELAFQTADGAQELQHALGKLANLDGNSFALMLHSLNKIFLLSLKNDYKPSEIIKGNLSADWKELDVSLLHEFLFKQILGIPQYIDESENIFYVKSAQDALSLVQGGLYHAVFLLNPTTCEQVLKITQGGEIMPHKSTYFYPKPLSGLIFYKWAPEDR
jgi:uncharacterized protein (DUF1015 family)